MKTYTINQILDIAKHGTKEEWQELLFFCEGYQGYDDELVGVKEFLANHKSSRIALLNFIKEIETNQPVFTKQSKKLRRIPNWVAVAAASVLLIAGLYVNHLLQNQQAPYIDPVMPIYLSTEGELLLNKGMAQYKKGDYLAAQETFSKLNSDTALYYQAICKEVLGDYRGSLNLLYQVSEGSIFYHKTKIRQANLHLMLNDDESAKLVIDGLVPQDELEAERIKSLKLRLH